MDEENGDYIPGLDEDEFADLKKEGMELATVKAQIADAALALLAQGLIKVPVGMRYVTRSDSQWETTEVWEIMIIEGATVTSKRIHAEILGGEIYTFDPNDPGNQKSQTLEEFFGDVFALPNIFTETRLSLPNFSLIGGTQERPQRDNGLIVRSGMTSHDLSCIGFLNNLFFESADNNAVINFGESGLEISGCNYDEYFLRDGSSVAGPTLGEGYWYSVDYEYKIGKVLEKFLGKKVRISFRKITFQDEVSVESPKQVIIGTIGQKELKGKIFAITLIDGAHNGGSVDVIPREAFLTGFIIEEITN